MNTGFGTNLEGFIIEGNVSITKAPIQAVDGDGSLEASGTIYIDTIREYSQTGGVTIQDTVFQNYQITVPYTQPSLGLTTASLLIDGGIYIRNTTNSTSLTSGGGLTVLGGASFNKDVHIGGITNVYDNRIINVQWPILGGDAANKDYVDSKTFGNSLIGNFTQGQVLVGGTGGNIEGFDTFVFNGQNLNISTPIIISNTELGLNTTTGALIVYGGGYFGDTTTIAAVLDMNSNYIQNVTDPVNLQDAATKKYVDDYGINDNFTTGQIIIGASDGFDIRGYDNLFFNIPDGTHGTVIFNQNTNLTLNNTTDALGLGSGGTLDIAGGVSIMGKTFMGDILDMNLKNIRNVQDPVLDYDAVNKRYIDNMFIDSEWLQLNVSDTPVDIPDLTFTSDIKAFISYVYVHTQDNCSLYTIRGINRNSNWYIQKTFVGGLTGIEFSIRFDSGSGIVQYTNSNGDDPSSIRYITPIIIYDVPDLDQINTSINANVNVPTVIPELTFDNSIYDAVKLAIYISNDSQNIYGLVYLNCVLIDSNWILNMYSFGDITGVGFDITDVISTGVIRYTNSSSNTYNLRIEVIDILKTQTQLTLTANTVAFTEIPELLFDNSLCIYNLTVFVTVPDLNKSALYTLEGFICRGQWYINNSYIGDTLGVQFSANTTVDSGIITYTNTNNFDAYIRYRLHSPTLVYIPLPVNKGGIGDNYLIDGTILRGNGVDPVIGTSDFVYNDYTLKLGQDSKVLLNNSENATGYTSGNVFVNLGGGSVAKDFYVGETLYVKNEVVVNDINITPSVGDLSKEQIFMGNHNVVQQPITGFIFSDPVIKSFNGSLCITVTTSTPTQLDALYTVKTLKKSSGWIIDYSYIGDNLSITLDIDSVTGQIRYTSPLIVNWVSTEMHFRGTTTTI